MKKLVKKVNQKICYVCEKPITTCAVYLGNNLFRHKQCKPGTKKWLKSNIALKSSVRHFFLHNDGS